MTRFYIVRHCAATSQEHSAALTERGIDQSQRLAEWLSHYPVDCIVTSPYVRAVETIRPLAERLGIEYTLDDRLRERVLSDKPLVDWKDKLRETFVDVDLKLTGGESSREAAQRAIGVVNDFATKGKNVVLVTHGNLMALLLKHFDNTCGFETWESLSNPDVYLAEEQGSAYFVSRVWPSNQFL